MKSLTEIRTEYELPDVGPDGGTLLHVAVEAIKVEAVKEILKDPHFDVNAENKSGKTALELAIENSLDSTVSADNAMKFRNIGRVLLGHDRLYRERQVNVSDIQTNHHLGAARPGGETLLHVAVQAINVKAVEEILQVPHFDVNAENTCGKTALELAIEKSLDRTVSADNARKFRNIERVLLGHDKVSAFVDRLYRERQVNVDAANAILLGAALIATITFSSWFTLPLPQDTSTNAPSPQDTSTNAPSPQVAPTNARAIEFPFFVCWVPLPAVPTLDWPKIK
ncbi:unnamed protein product [Sphagnum compactum]